MHSKDNKKETALSEQTLSIMQNKILFLPKFISKIQGK